MLEQEIMEAINEKIIIIILLGNGCGKTIQNIIMDFRIFLLCWWS